MTIGLVGQSQITTFVTPVNGATPIDANTVRGNDNTIKTAYDIHDNDGTIHLQSTTLGARPTAATAGAGAKWFTTDGFRLYYSDGTNWTEAAYALAAGPTFTGTVTVTLGTITTSTPAFSSTATWNAIGTTFVHQFVNVTDTASTAGSLLADWQVGSTSQWQVTKAGAVTQTGALAIVGAFSGATSVAFSTSVASTTALATPSAFSATRFTAFASTVSGATLMGYGTTGDVTLKNRSGTDVLVVSANTTTVTTAGDLGLNTNNTFLLGKDTGGTARGILGIDGSDVVQVGTIVSAMTLRSSGTVKIPALAGVGTRAVVADANGVLCAP
jgi:hypothetical protein